MPTMNAKHPRVVVNAAALVDLVYTGINVAQDMVAGHFSNDDKMFVASFLVGLILLLVPLAGGNVVEEPTAPTPVAVEAEDAKPAEPAKAE